MFRQTYSDLQTIPFPPHKLVILLWLALAFDCDGGHWTVGSIGGKIQETHAQTVLLELDFLAGGQQASGLDGRHQARDHGGGTGPEMDVHVQGVSGACKTCVTRPPRLALIGICTDSCGIDPSGLWARYSVGHSRRRAAGDQARDHDLGRLV